MRKKVLDENQIIREFLGYNLIDKPIYNYKDELIDKDKTLKDYGFSKGDYIYFSGLAIGGTAFTENKFFERIVLSELIKEKNQDIIEIYSPSRSSCEKIHYLYDNISLDIIGSNEGPVFGGKYGRYSLDSNVCKAAVFEGKVNIGQKGIIQIKIIKNKNYFEGDTRNGIKTSDFRFITDFCFTFTDDKVLSEDYYHPKIKLIKSNY